MLRLVSCNYLTPNSTAVVSTRAHAGRVHILQGQGARFPRKIWRLQLFNGWTGSGGRAPGTLMSKPPTMLIHYQSYPSLFSQLSNTPPFPPQPYLSNCLWSPFGLRYHIMAGSLSGNPRGEQAIAITSVFTAAAFITVCLRFYTRLYIIRCAGIEDFGIAVAMVRPRISVHHSFHRCANMPPALLNRPDNLHWNPYV